jgi:hypothetical protein
MWPKPINDKGGSRHTHLRLESDCKESMNIKVSGCFSQWSKFALFTAPAYEFFPDSFKVAEVMKHTKTFLLCIW